MTKCYCGRLFERFGEWVVWDRTKGRNVCFKCYIENPLTLINPTCRRLLCQPELLGICKICHGPITRTVHHVDDPFRNDCDLGHICGRIEYAKGCMGKSHECVRESA